jgi:ureidoglycolate hydrolase
MNSQTSSARVDYLNPNLPSDVEVHTVPVVDATHENFKPFGLLVKEIDACDIEIVRWPATGWRPVDEDSGDEAGTTEGYFLTTWDGDILHGSNEAVGGEYLLAYGTEPDKSRRGHSNPPDRMFIWHANYHPDGGQLFFPQTPGDYLMPVAPPGDDVKPEDFVCFRFPSDVGCYIHPNIWHEGVFPLELKQGFFGRQGKVHARVSVDFAREFNRILELSWK